jgi:hypothetical protein
MNLTLILVIIIVLGLLIGGSIYLWKRNSKGFSGANTGKTAQQMKNNTGNNPYLPVATWGAFIPNTTADGNCLNYTIVAGKYNPGTATYADLNADGGGGYIVSKQNCLDIDQIYAQAGSHICANDNAGAAGTGCISTVTIPYVDNLGADQIYPPGSLVPVGTTEGVYTSTTAGSSFPYFVPCNVPNNSTSSGSGVGLATCDGTIGLIVPTFTPQQRYNQDTLCNTASGQNLCLAFDEVIPDIGNRKYYDVVVKDCDLGDFKEIFRVTRYSLDSNYQLVPDPVGKLASIIYRLNGYYLAPQMKFSAKTNSAGVITGFQYFFDQLNIDVDVSADQSQNTVKMQLINPADDTERLGVYWLLQDQIPNPTYQVDTIAPQQYFGCNVLGLPIPSGSKNPFGTSCPITGVPDFYKPLIYDPLDPDSIPFEYFATSPVAPQQFLYVPDLKQVPNTTEPSDQWTYLINQFSLTNITYDGKDIPVLQASRTSIPTKVYATLCQDFDSSYTGTGYRCIQKYDPLRTSTPVYPISTIPGLQYYDSQFISYGNFIQAITKGVSPLTPGCTQYATKVNGNVFNPFGSNVNILISTPGN